MWFFCYISTLYFQPVEYSPNIISSWYFSSLFMRMVCDTFKPNWSALILCPLHSPHALNFPSTKEIQIGILCLILSKFVAVSGHPFSFSDVYKLVVLRICINNFPGVRQAGPGFLFNSHLMMAVWSIGVLSFVYSSFISCLIEVFFSKSWRNIVLDLLCLLFIFHE